MKPSLKKTSTQPQTSEYVHPWYEYVNRPNAPTEEMIERAKFVDKTYVWKERQKKA
jgi:hypothetical protein